MRKLLVSRAGAAALVLVMVAALVMVFAGFGDAGASSAARCHWDETSVECPKMIRAPEVLEGDAVALCWSTFPWLGFTPGICSVPGQNDLV